MFLIRKNMINLIITALLLISALMTGCGVQYEDGYLTVNGANLYYKTMGEGEPVLILHGGPGMDHSYLLPQMEELAKTNRLIFFDQRSSGLSTGIVDSSNMSIDVMVEDIESFRKEFNLGKMNLMSHSWGGLLAMFYAVKYPENLNSLIFVGSISASSAYRIPASQILQRRFSLKEEIARRTLTLSPEFQAADPEALTKFFRMIYKRTFYDTSKVSDLTLKFSDDYREKNQKTALLSKDLSNYDIHSKLSAITCPTLLLYGDYDPQPLEAVQKLQESISGSELVVIEKSGHFPYIETPGEFFGHIRDFLDKN